MGSLGGGANLGDGAESVGRRARRFAQSSRVCRSAARGVHPHCLSQLLPSRLVDHPPIAPTEAKIMGRMEDDGDGSNDKFRQYCIHAVWQVTS